MHTRVGLNLRLKTVEGTSKFALIYKYHKSSSSVCFWVALVRERNGWKVCKCAIHWSKIFYEKVRERNGCKLSIRCNERKR